MMVIMMLMIMMMTMIIMTMRRMIMRMMMAMLTSGLLLIHLVEGGDRTGHLYLLTLLNSQGRI